MTVPFNYIPQGLRQPLFYAEMDNSAANYGQPTRRRLLIGQKLSTGSAAVATPLLVGTTDGAKSAFGRGSMLARMHAAMRAVDPVGEIWCIALADAGPGVNATGTITVTGPATGAGTINLYIAGQRVQVGVALSDSANTVAAAIVTAVNGSTDLPVTAVAASAVVTLTCRWKGATGNDITVLDSFRGTAGGEARPAGIGLAYVAMASGATNPSLTAAIIAMGDEEYDYVVHPYTDSTNLDYMQTEMGESSGRWSYSRLIFGHAYSALRGDLSSLTTAGGLRNDQHQTIAAIDADCPNPCWEYAACYAARNAVFLDANVARPTQTGELTGMLPPRAGQRFLFTEVNSLLSYGIATSYVAGGSLRVGRAITTYQENTFGQADASYLDSETLHQSAYVLRDLRSVITSKYARHALASDGTAFGAGAAIVTPSVIRGELVARYRALEADGIVENAEAFAANLIVEIDSNNPNRLNVLYPPDYVNQLRVFAVLNQFRLQYPVAA